jgi:hypothetical protein
VLGNAKERALNLAIYPNPAHDLIHVSWEAENQMEVDFKVIDYLGRMVLYKKIYQVPNATNEYEFSKNNLLGAGMYFIQVGNNVRKLIVE